MTNKWESFKIKIYFRFQNHEVCKSVDQWLHATFGAEVLWKEKQKQKTVRKQLFDNHKGKLWGL